MIARLSLRARLVVGVIVLAAAGLVAADVATYSSLRSFLVQRTDGSLDGAAHQLGHGPGRPRLGSEQSLGGVVPGDFVQVRTAAGRVVVSSGALRRPDGGTDPPPKLPRSIAVPAPSLEGDPDDHASRFTVGATSGDGRYRVRASAIPGTGLVLVVATSLHDVDGTLHRLVLIELLVTALVIAALAALALWVVRVGLRPLEAIGHTAAAIAAGDLSRRVERAEERTEVGRLGLALNVMLAQIESAFRAREASERKLRRFVADASHELRTPLAAVRAYAELFDRGAEHRPDDLARSMSGISRESERMSLLVDDLLLLARLDEGRPLEREPVALDEVVGESVETARTVEPERPIALDASPVGVVGDRERLRQIVDNLLANVRAHTPAGTAVRVAVVRDGDDGVVTVADDGPGLEAAQAAHVFERFYRADTSRTRASGGVGLGLAIVAAVAEAHGGTVEVESAPGEGATFRIRLPLAGRPVPAQATGARPDRSRSSSASGRTGRANR
ncbi:MAG TPA: HAMP domain-containing sensor histidine kinase [Gaiellaceae bacterium]|nr:HAMP domain-containing sensor histidine kinase [Gaiellaceae bacterium]